MNFSKSILGILLFCISIGFAQTSKFDWDKVNFGGGLNIDFSNSNTSIIVSPSAIYNVNQQFSLGAGVNFGYTNFRSSDAKSYNYGVSLLSYYNPFSTVQLSAEIEQTFVNTSTKISGQTIKTDFNFLALYLGAGYRLGNNVIAGVRYDVLYKEDKSLFTSPFSPFVRVYF